MAAVLRTAFLLLAGLWLLGLHMLLLEGAPPRIRTLAVAMPGWPAAAPPLKVALLSDLHVATPGDTPELLADTVRRVNALGPDIVVLAGDFLSRETVHVHSYGPVPTVAPLAGLRPRLGTVAILGNHDYEQGSEVIAALADIGIPTLDNQAMRIGPLAVIGISDAYSHHDDTARAIASWQRIGGVPVVLTHSPDVIPGLPPEVTLALAGHTHCGQVSQPLLGPPVTNSIYGRRYVCGVVRDGARTSVITAGLGTSGLPLRLDAAPDLWLLTLGR
jgi:predicted MPP superfamily phosphohydrolase